MPDVHTSLEDVADFALGLFIGRLAGWNAENLFFFFFFYKRTSEHVLIHFFLYKVNLARHP